MKQIRVLALSDPEYSTQLESILECEYINRMAIMQPISANLERAVSLPVDVVILYTYKFSESEVKFLEQLYMRRTDMAMVLLCPEAGADIMTRAMTCGVSRVVTTDMDPKDICSSLVMELARLRNRQSSMRVQDYDSRVVTVYGAKGGCGKTTVAVNLAVALQKSGKKVALLDLDLEFGDVGVFLNLPRCEGISDLIGEPKLTASTVSNYLVRHASGVMVLCAPPSPEYAELVHPDHIERIVTVLRAEYDYLIFDTPSTMNDCTLAAMEQADVIYMITNPEISTLKNTRVCLEILKTLDYFRKVKMILNRDGESFISERDVENALDMKLALVIPADGKSNISAINRGIPVVTSAAKSKLSKTVTGFTAQGRI